MNASLATKALIWKESRQILQLLLVLLIPGIVFASIPFPTDYGLGRWQMVVVTVVLPYLFAISSGVLLVGAEKESNSLRWLRSLPIDNRSIVLTKLAVAFGALVVVWLFAGGLIVVQHAIENEQILATRQLTAWEFLSPISVIYSFFLLATGFTVAWRVKHPLTSLVISVFVGIFMVLFLQSSWAVSSLFVRTNSVVIETGRVTLALLFLVVVSSAACWWSGLRYLRPDAAPRIGLRILDWIPRPAITTKLWELAPMPVSSSLVRQNWLQNRISYLLLTFFLIAAVPSVAFSTSHLFDLRSIETGSIFFMIAIGLTASWLGVIPFASEQFQNRAHFLAARGVSPWRVWRSKLVVSFSLALIVSISWSWTLYSLIRYEFMFRQDPSMSSVFSDALYLIALVCFVAAALFTCFLVAVGQWIGQVVRSPILAGVGTLMSAALLAYYAWFVVRAMEMPVWMLCLFITIPLAATGATCRMWLDNRRTLKFFAIHAICMVLLVGLPLLPAAVRLLTLPGVPASAAQEMIETANNTKANRVAFQKELRDI